MLSYIGTHNYIQEDSMSSLLLQYITKNMMCTAHDNEVRV